MKSGLRQSINNDVQILVYFLWKELHNLLNDMPVAMVDVVKYTLYAMHNIY